MADDFVRQLKERVSVTDAEVGVLTAVDVRSYEDLHSLIEAFPSIASAGVELPKLSGATYGELAEGVTARADRNADEQWRVSFGALPPADAAMTREAVVGMPSPIRTMIALSSDEGRTAKPIDLRLANWKVKSQGARGTCVSFGTTACAEHALAESGYAADLSEQFLYWAVKTGSGDPYPDEDGTWLEFSKAALAVHGICLESDWPYVDVAVTPVSGGSAGLPSNTARAAAAKHRISASLHQRNPKGAAGTLLAALERGRPAALCLPVFQDPLTPNGPTNWDTPVGWRYGHILNPPPTSKVVSGHCVCVVGYAPDPEERAGGHFVVRNSWSERWGEDNPSPESRAPAPGYGFVSATYVNTHAWELFQI